MYETNRDYGAKPSKFAKGYSHEVDWQDWTCHFQISFQTAGLPVLEKPEPALKVWNKTHAEKLALKQAKSAWKSAEATKIKQALKSYKSGSVIDHVTNKFIVSHEAIKRYCNKHNMSLYC